ncbi:MAG: hypothetical protein H8E12_08930 [Rhodobacteraceae bacterium]|nr:hypothetical protein [Paracoccaceae bacterium]
MKIGDYVYDSAVGREGLIVGFETAVTSGDNWEVLYDDGVTDWALTSELKVIYEMV